MLAALSIALIGIASHMVPKQVLFLCAHLIPGYYFTFIDSSRCQKTACVSARARSLPCTVELAPLLKRAQCGPSPYVLLIAVVDKYSMCAGGWLLYHPDPHLFPNVPIIS